MAANGNGGASERSTIIDGLALRFRDGIESPLFCERDLATLAGADARSFARAAKRAESAGDLTIWKNVPDGSESCFAIETTEVVDIGSGAHREVTRLLFDEEGALESLMRLRTPLAKALRRKVRRVFLAYMKGQHDAERRDTDERLLAGIRDRGVSIRNLPAEREQVTGAIFGAAIRCGRSWQWVDHQVRKAFGLRGYLDLKLPDVGAALTHIAHVAMVAKSTATAYQRQRARERDEADRRRGQLKLIDVTKPRSA